MSFREAIVNVFRNYAEFNGRARRSEYWYFTLFNILVYMLVYILAIVFVAVGFAGRTYGSLTMALGSSSVLFLLYGLYSLGIIVPSLAVTCRRLHDIGRPGSYLLIALVPVVGWIFLLIWVLQEGEPGTNRYGADPRGYTPVQPRRYAEAPAPRPERPAAIPGTTVYTDYQTRDDQLTAPVGAASFSLEGTEGCFRGRRVPIRGTLTAGRDTACTLAFPGDTHGVSRQHCQLRAQGSRLFVTDLGSSCGTFVNGRQLTPRQAVSLSPGDSISLGSAKQSFRVIQGR